MSKSAISKDIPWIELYRPKTFGDIKGHEDIVQILSNGVKTNTLQHMIMHGPPGTGKTSCILAYANAMYGDDIDLATIMLNASDKRGIDIVRTKITKFISSSLSLCQGDYPFKLVILDEIDAMTNDAQAILKKVIEQYTNNARFCLICNQIEKISEALRSRCLYLLFSKLPKQCIYNTLKFIENDQKASQSTKITDKGIKYLSRYCNGDIRKAIGTLQSVYTNPPSKIVDEYVIMDALGCIHKYILRDIIKFIVTDISVKDAHIGISKILNDNNISIDDLLVAIHGDIVSHIIKGNISSSLVWSLIPMSKLVYGIIKLPYINAHTNTYIQLACLISIFR